MILIFIGFNAKEIIFFLAFCLIPDKIVYLQGEIAKDFQMRIKDVLDDNGPIVFEPDVYKDSRGYFFESFNSKVLKDIKELTDFHINFVQDNESRSSAGVFRGFHFQLPPYEQAKLLRVVQGAVVDIVIDLRKDSPYYTKIYSITLSDDNKYLFYIPAGFAHGFLSLKDDTIFQYKCSNVYNKESEGGINVSSIGALDHLLIKTISDKDKSLPSLDEFLKNNPFQTANYGIKY